MKLMVRCSQTLVRLALGFLLLTATAPANAAPAATAAPGASKWETVSSENGITVQRVFVPGSPVLRFRANGMVHASVVNILALLQDVKNQRRWNKNTYANRIVQRVSDQELIVYNAARTPWPFKDRDYLMRLKLQVDKKHRLIVVRGQAITHPRVPEHPDRVRVKVMRTRWIFKPSAKHKGRRTWVSFEMHADPGGNMPNWLINFISKFIPRKTIENIRREVARGGLDQAFVKKFSRFKDWY